MEYAECIYPGRFELTHNNITEHYHVVEQLALLQHELKLKCGAWFEKLYRRLEIADYFKKYAFRKICR